MSYKKSTYVSLIMIMAFALLFLFNTGDLSSLQPNQPVSPATFPRMISILIIVMSLISIFLTSRKADEKVEVANIRYLVYTVIALILYVFVWQFVGYFYLATFVFLTYLLYLYTNKSRIKNILHSMIISVVVTTIIYLVFGMFLSVKF